MEKNLNCSGDMCSVSLDQKFWNERWENASTGWDIGYPSPPIEDYLRKIEDKSISILIPGCGNAYEAEFLVKHGFTNVTLIDIAPKAVEILHQKFQSTPQIEVLCEDFFQHKGQYDLIVEQTFFCAIHPSERKKYASKTAELLNADGKIIGLLFNRTFDTQGPPFGGNKEEYSQTFEPFFIINSMETAENSIPQRKGSELFIEFTKK